MINSPEQWQPDDEFSDTSNTRELSPESPRRITHYLRNPVDPDSWVQLYFVTQDADGHFYFGFEHIKVPPDEIQRRFSAEEIVPFVDPPSMNERQELWITPEGEIWLTSGPEPIEDLNKIRLTPASHITQSSQTPSTPHS